jgi:hypothetical protein
MQGGRDEIFVDVVERITVTFNSSGYLSQAQVQYSGRTNCPDVMQVDSRDDDMGTCWPSLATLCVPQLLLLKNQWSPDS